MSKNYMERNSKKDLYLKIKSLYVSKKYDALIKEATQFLSCYPEDLNVRFMRAKAYRSKEMFKESIEDLKFNLSIDQNPHSIVELYYIYYHLNMYNEALLLLPVLYENDYINSYSLAISEYIMKKQLGLNKSILNKDNYVTNQITNYDKEMAVLHITNKHQFSPLRHDSIFHKNININYLFETVEKNIDNKKKINTEEILEIHYFAVPNIGYYNNNTCNFIKVIVIPNTNQIISLYPVDYIDDANFEVLNYDRDKLIIEEKIKQKTKSRIDVFNERYGIK